MQLGFQVNRYDPCIITKPEIQKLCYVDDIANRADSKVILDTHIRHLEKVYGKMTVQYGPTVHFLGVPTFNYLVMVQYISALSYILVICVTKIWI